ncbi:MAG: hypothetical protein M3P44_17785 [Actinomycetota bacterium]|nr:hypothetical protein [Actinomycetota bacterium]
MPVKSDRVHRDLGTRYAAIDDHVEQVVVAVERDDVGDRYRCRGQGPLDSRLPANVVRTAAVAHSAAG